MIKPASILASALTLLSLAAQPALADLVHLRNGRTLEGKVIRADADRVHLEVSGGRLVLPADDVARIERRDTPEEAYGERARRTDLSDPVAVEQLAEWARRRGLPERAEQLQDLALGLRLQERVDAARGTRWAEDYLEIYRWAREQGASTEVLRWLLDQALAVEPEHEGAQIAVRALQREADQARARAAAQQERHRARADERTRRAEVARLEAALASQRQEARDLRDRLEAIEASEARREREREALRPYPGGYYPGRVVIVQPRRRQHVKHHPHGHPPGRGHERRRGPRPLAPIMRGPLIQPIQPADPAVGGPQPPPPSPHHFSPLLPGR